MFAALFIAGLFAGVLTLALGLPAWAGLALFVAALAVQGVLALYTTWYES